MCVQTELKSSRGDHSSPDAREGNPHSTSPGHSLWDAFSLTSTAPAITHLTAVFPPNHKHSEARAKSVLFMLHTQPLITCRGPNEVFSLYYSEIQKPIKKNSKIALWIEVVW